MSVDLVSEHHEPKIPKTVNVIYMIDSTIYYYGRQYYSTTVVYCCRY